MGQKDQKAIAKRHEEEAAKLLEKHEYELRQKEAVTFALDTTLLPDGWHILSYHVHAIDHRVVPGFTGNQLASEVEIPICVDNQGAGSCTAV